MPHVEIHPTGIGEKTAVAGWLIMASVMEVQHTPLLDMEDVVTNPVRQPGWGMFGAVLIDQQPIFRLKPENTVQHLSSPLRIEGPSAGDVKDLPA